MSGQLCWLSSFSSGGKLALYLRHEPSHPWKPHTSYPGLCVPDYPIPGGSKGWATCQKLLQSGWTIIPTNQARSAIETPISNLMHRFVANQANRSSP
jgi:hypothetical protein